MADHGIRCQSPAQPQLGKAVFDGEERGLREAGLLERLIGLRSLRTAAEQDIQQVLPEQGQNDSGAQVELFTEDGFRLVQLTPHARPLRALSRKHEGDPPVHDR